MSGALRLLVRVLPLAGGLALLLELPRMDPLTSVGGAWPLPWRCDALAIALGLALALGIALAPWHAQQLWRLPLVSALLAVALLTDQLILLALVLLALGLLLADRRWMLAGGLLLLAALLLAAAGAMRWSDPQAGPRLSSPTFLLLALACLAGLGTYPFSLMAARPDALRRAAQPIWLLPLLRTVAWGPWNSGWALALVLVGAVGALWAAGAALGASDDETCHERLSGLWLSMALACLGLLTSVGMAAALWLPYGIAVSQPLLTGRRRMWAMPLPPTLMFTAVWLALGATAASGAMVLAAALLLATLIGVVAGYRTPEAAPHEEAPLTPTARAALALTLGGGLLTPLAIRALILPAVDQLQGGLTPFGLITIWPWVGLAALDAGQRRVAVLPSIALLALALVIGALVWLVARAAQARQGTTAAEAAPQADLQQALRQVWWLRGRRRG
ncbi:hypothetical protein [Kallotenue papyrolyticum]|uniref:hypothetical protein n=1 Tax=Kallotenue papyrolyticum TaxID=1325125 RepID=UPI0004929B18|nr:hypothetical protein [Kallotenue papyrolyticum]